MSLDLASLKMPLTTLCPLMALYEFRICLLKLHITDTGFENLLKG